MQKPAPSHTFDVSEYLDVSVTELLVLMHLLRNEGALIVRKSLLDEINAALAGNKISTSSYYHKLDRLAKQGLIRYDQDKKYITSTELTKMVIGDIRRLTTFASLDTFEFTKRFIPEFVAEAKIDVQENILIVYLEEGLDVRIANLISDYGEQIYVLSSDESFARYQERGAGDNILQTRYFDDKIREADDYFDGAVILGYDCRREFNGTRSVKWLEETVRVVKPDGLIILSGLGEIPKSDHLLLDNFAKDMETSYLFKFIDMDELLKDLQRLKVEKVQTYDYQGMVIIYGTNAK